MEISDLFTTDVDSVIRNIKYRKEHNESFDDYVTYLFELYKFESELFIHIVNNDFDITYDEFSNLCHKYINRFKKDNYTVASFFFNIWNHCRYYFNNCELKLDDFIKPATEEEIKQARLDFGHIKEMHHDEVHEHDHTFSKDAKVLEYRGIRFIIDNEWGDAWYKTKDEKVHHFRLIYDWWYPIDELISLEL